MAQPLRAGIIGQGRSGRNIHGRCLSKHPDQYKIVAVADALEERRLRAEAEYGCQSYADYQDMLQRDDLDFVVNATTSMMHVPVSLELLNHGFHVICEKPLSRNVEDVDLLAEAARKAGKVFAVFQNYRYTPAFVELKKVVDSGVLGRLIQVSIE